MQENSPWKIINFLFFTFKKASSKVACDNPQSLIKGLSFNIVFEAFSLLSLPSRSLSVLNQSFLLKNLGQIFNFKGNNINN
jgi:hypothetical protein